LVIARQVFAGGGNVPERLHAALRVADIVLVGTSNIAHLREDAAMIADAQCATATSVDGKR
jgi:hypothetical protein